MYSALADLKTKELYMTSQTDAMYYFCQNFSPHIVPIYKAAELFCLQTSNVPTFALHGIYIMTIYNDNICHCKITIVLYSD